MSNESENLLTPVPAQVQPRFEVQHDIATPVGEVGLSIQLGMPAKIGDIVELYKVTASEDAASTTLVGKAVVFDGWRGTFSELPGRLFDAVDNVNARTYGGLLAALTLQYGQSFNTQSQITAFYYRRYQ